MNLKNYTSTVAASTSMARIEKKLVEIGASQVNKEYKNQICVGVKFEIEVKGVPVSFELPAKVDTVYKVMRSEVKRPNENTDTRIKEQAERTAWKIIADWVDVQASMIYLEQAEVLQVFMPYAITKEGKTVYQLFTENSPKLLGGGNRE